MLETLPISDKDVCTSRVSSRWGGVYVSVCGIISSCWAAAVVLRGAVRIQNDLHGRVDRTLRKRNNSVHTSQSSGYIRLV